MVFKKLKRTFASDDKFVEIGKIVALHRYKFNIDAMSRAFSKKVYQFTNYAKPNVEKYMQTFKDEWNAKSPGWQEYILKRIENEVTYRPNNMQ